MNTQNSGAANAEMFARAKESIAQDMEARNIGAIIWDNASANFHQIPEIELVCPSTGNTRTALGITLVCVTAYTLYTLWLVYVLRADVALCWTADHVYYLISLALSYAYIRSGRWRRLKI